MKHRNGIGASRNIFENSNRVFITYGGSHTLHRLALAIKRRGIVEQANAGHAIVVFQVAYFNGNGTLCLNGYRGQKKKSG